MMLRVSFWDHVSSDDWMTKEEATKVTPSKVSLLGHLVSETDDYLILAMGYDTDNKNYTNVFAVLKSTVFGREQLSIFGEKSPQE